jgi:hypothetical protein
MTGGMTHLKGCTAKVQNKTAGESETGRRAGWQADTEKGGTSPGVPEREVGRMQGDDRRLSQEVHQVPGSPDVVKVGVSDPDLADLPMLPAGPGRDDLPIPGGINDGRLAGI